MYRGAEAPANTDHRLLVASVAVSPRFAHRAAREQKYDVQRMSRDPGLANSYAVTVHNKFDALGPIFDDVEEAWTTISSVNRDSADKIGSAEW